MRSHTGEKPFECTIDGCESRFARRDYLTKHIRSHNNERQHECKECKMKFVRKSSLNGHIKSKHSSIKKYKCLTDGCNMTFSLKYGLTFHVKSCHSDEREYKCHVCGSEFVQKSHLEQHMTIHSDKRAFKCQIDGCLSSFKRSYSLRKHLLNIHDIGDHTCEICLNKCNAQTPYKDPNKGNVKICRKCFRMVSGGHNTRVELKMSKFLDKYLGTQFLIASDRAMSSVGGCGLRRPDKLYASPDVILHVECDEQQHKYGNYTYICEKSRLVEINESFNGVPHIVIRWNPDHYKPPTGLHKLKRQERLQVLLRIIQESIANPPSEPISLIYLFYDRDNESVIHEWSPQFIYE